MARRLAGLALPAPIGPGERGPSWRATSILVINAAGAETRVALVENGTIDEYYLERKREKGIVGNIYKGRVVRVLPGMQAAFVDIGLEKAAFLYVGDVYGDPDFSEEFELTEGEHPDDVTDVPSEQEAEEAEARAQAAADEPPAPTAPAGSSHGARRRRSGDAGDAAAEAPPPRRRRARRAAESAVAAAAVEPAGAPRARRAGGRRRVRPRPPHRGCRAGAGAAPPAPLPPSP